MKEKTAELIIEILRNKINDFVKEYDEEPRYIKVPIWVLISLRDYAREMMTNFLYIEDELEEKNDFTFCGLKVCPTITIRSVEEIEVF